jgi:uncharacterized membrane protein
MPGAALSVSDSALFTAFGYAHAGGAPLHELEDRLRRMGRVEQRLLARVAAFGGSWPFIGLFEVFMSAWILVNPRGPERFDPFPFILLNLLLS